MSNTRTAICPTLIIPPGGLQRIDIEGDFYHVVAANFEFELMRTGTGFMPVQQGDEETLPVDENGKQQTYRIIDIRNPATNGTLQVTIYAGYGRRKQSRQSVLESPTEMIAGPGGMLPAGGSVTIDPSITGTRIRRKSVTVSNGSALSRLMIRDELGNNACPVFPEYNVQLPISGPVIIHNPNGAPVEYYTSEIYWVSR